MASKSAKRRRKRRARSRTEGSPPEADATEADAEEPIEASAPRSSAPAPRRARSPADGEEAPPAPWGSFPLVELAVLTGIVMLILGFFVVDGSRGAILIGTGLALGSIGGLELSIREHFAGYRSHTLVLAGVPALIVLGLLFYIGPDGLPQLARAAIAVAVFAAAAFALMEAFARRSGGVRFRFSSFREWTRRR